MTEAADRLHVAAPSALRKQQHEARRDLMAGFDSRQDILLWQHRVTATTIGRIPDEWHRSLLTDRWLVAALLVDPDDRAALTDHPPGEDQARNVRLDMIQDDLIPASQTAIEDFWRGVTEYTEESGPVDPEAQKFLAMRPRVHELASDQERALRWALNAPEKGTLVSEHAGPIDDREAMLEWVDEVVYATNGGVDQGFAARVCNPTSEWWRPLLVTRGPMLELLLVDDVLPTMNRALREVANQATEFPAEEREQPPIPQG